MLYFMMILTSSIFDWKQLFCTNCLFKLTFGTQIDLIILDFIMLTCLFLKLKISFLNIVIVNTDMQTNIKLKFFVKLNFATQINENILNLMIILIFSILDQKYRFSEHLIQKVESIGLSSSLVRYLCEYAEFDNHSNFFLFQTKNTVSFKFDQKIPNCLFKLNFDTQNKASEVFLLEIKKILFFYIKLLKNHI